MTCYTSRGVGDLVRIMHTGVEQEKGSANRFGSTKNILWHTGPRTGKGPKQTTHLGVLACAQLVHEGARGHGQAVNDAALEL